MIEADLTQWELYQVYVSGSALYRETTVTGIAYALSPVYVIDVVTGVDVAYEGSDVSVYATLDGSHWVEVQNGMNYFSHPGDQLRFYVTFDTPTSYLSSLSYSYITTQPGKNFDRLIATIASELELDDVIYDVEHAHFVNDATGKSLEMIGEFFRVHRSEDESDENFRQRIISQVSQMFTSGTLSDIRSLLSNYLGISEDQITIEELGDATIRINLPSHFYERDSEIQNFVKYIKPAGVAVELFYVGDLWDVAKWDEGVWGS